MGIAGNGFGMEATRVVPKTPKYFSIPHTRDHRSKKRIFRAAAATPPHGSRLGVCGRALALGCLGLPLLVLAAAVDLAPTGDGRDGRRFFASARRATLALQGAAAVAAAAAGGEAVRSRALGGALAALCALELLATLALSVSRRSHREAEGAEGLGGAL